MSGLVLRGYPLEPEAEHVRQALKRLQAMVDGKIDEAEALQAAGEWTLENDDAPRAPSAQPRKETEDDDDN